MGTSKVFLSNALLVLGIFCLGGFAAFTLYGAQIDPIVPAFAALCIACTALLDRISRQEIE